MKQHHTPAVSAATLAEMALVSDLAQAAAAVAAGGIDAGRALMVAAGRKLEAVPLERWNRVFAVALEVVTRREESDRVAHLRALAEVVGEVGKLAGAAEQNEGENP